MAAADAATPFLIRVRTWSLEWRNERSSRRGVKLRRPPEQRVKDAGSPELGGRLRRLIFAKAPLIFTHTP